MSLTTLVLSLLCTAYSIWRVISLMAKDGYVDNGGRVMIFMSFIPGVSFLLAFCLVVVESLFFIGEQIDKFRATPRYITWKINRQIRKPWRGPIVRAVEYLHNKRKEKQHEEDVSEV